MQPGRRVLQRRALRRGHRRVPHRAEPEPRISGCIIVLGASLLQKGEAEAALAAMEREPCEAWRLIGLPMVYFALGRKAESDAALAELIANTVRKRPTTSPTCWPSAAKPTAPSSGWTRRWHTGPEARSDIAVDPLFANIHSDPRWLPFLRKLGKAPEQLAEIKFDVKVPN